MKPAGILNAGIDSAEQQPLFEQAAAAGIKIVGWHAGPKPGPVEGIPSVFTNVTTDPAEVANSAGYEAVVQFQRARGRRAVHRLDLRHRHRQDQPIEGGGRRLHGVQGARNRRYPDRRPLQPHGPADDFAAFQIRREMDLFDRRQRSLLRLLGAGAAGGGRRSGDGLPAADLVRRRIGAGVQAHPRQAISARHRRRAAQPARLDHDRRNQPRLRRREAERASCRTCICSPPRTSTRTAAPRTSSIPATATATNTRRSGA